MTRYLSVFLLVIFVFFGWLGDAHAYINPGKGSVLQQLLAGGFGGFMIVVKALLRKVFALFGRK